MPKVDLEFTGDTDTDLIYVDDHGILSGAGSVSRDLSEGDHALTWFVRGAPGSEYTVSITNPLSAHFSHKATLDQSTKDAGLHWFRVEGDE
jgi:hypothetical protein